MTEPEVWKPKFNPWAIAVVVAMAAFMEVLDTSIANVALPHLAGDLGASNDESTWVLTSYLVSNAVVLPMSGWLATAFGRKRFFMLCILLFTATSLLCGIAPSLGMLVLFRVIQGAGGGGLQPLAQAILADTFPPEKRGLAFALYGITAILAPTIGPTLGGWLTDNYSWRWIFYINLPVGILALFLVLRMVEASSDWTPRTAWCRNPHRLRGYRAVGHLQFRREQLVKKAADEGNVVIVGRGAAHYLHDCENAFHTFVYAPFEDKVQRLLIEGKNQAEAMELIEHVDSDRTMFIKEHFGIDWPARQFFPLMVNSMIGEETVVDIILGGLEAAKKGKLPGMCVKARERRAEVHLLQDQKGTKCQENLAERSHLSQAARPESASPPLSDSSRRERTSSLLVGDRPSWTWLRSLCAAT
jgi:hypothetical protein